MPNLPSYQRTSLPSQIVYDDEANTYADLDQIIRSSRLKLRNPANSFSYVLVSSAIAADRNITLPLLTTSDEMVTKDFTQTLTNKTIAFLTSGLAIRNPANTFSYLVASSAITANRIVTLPLLTADDVLVTEAFTQTLTNKTLTSPKNATFVDVIQATAPSSPPSGTRRLYLDSGDSVFKSKKSDGSIILHDTGAGAVTVREAGVQVGSTSRKLNFITDTDFFLTEDAGNDEIEVSIANGAIFDRHVDWSMSRALTPTRKTRTPFGFTGVNSTSGSGLFSGNLTSGIGTYTITVGSNGVAGQFVTGAVSGNQSGFRVNTNICERAQDCKLRFRFSLTASTLVRMFIGFASGATGAFLVGADSLNARHGFGLSVDTSVDANFKCIHNDGSGASVRDNLTTTTALNNAYHDVELAFDNANSRFQLQFDALAIQNVTTDIPALATDMTVQCFVETATTAARDFWIAYCEGETETDDD